MNTGLIFTRWPETRLQINDNVTPKVLDMQISNCLLTSSPYQLRDIVFATCFRCLQVAKKKKTVTAGLSVKYGWNLLFHSINNIVLLHLNWTAKKSDSLLQLFKITLVSRWDIYIMYLLQYSSETSAVLISSSLLSTRVGGLCTFWTFYYISFSFPRKVARLLLDSLQIYS